MNVLNLHIVKTCVKFLCCFFIVWCANFHNTQAQHSAWTFPDIVNVPKRPTLSSEVERRFTTDELGSRSKQRRRHSFFGDLEDEDECENLDESELMRRMKDEGDYNPKYMATSIEEAADKFEDLSARNYLSTFKSAPSTCDEDCVSARESLISKLKSQNKLPPEDQIILRPDISNMRPKMGNAAMSQYNRHNRRQFDQFSTNTFFGGGGISSNNAAAGGGHHASSVATNFGGGSIFARGRGKRFAARGDFPDSIPTSALDQDIGQGTTVYCWKAGDQGRDKNKNLHHMCTACRSMKVLSNQHFPKYLNQVECGGGECLMGQGICAKQYIQVKVLKNSGTKRCQKWIKETISLSVCCDCMLKRESGLYQDMMLNYRNNNQIKSSRIHN